MLAFATTQASFFLSCRIPRSTFSLPSSDPHRIPRSTSLCPRPVALFHDRRIRCLTPSKIFVLAAFQRPSIVLQDVLFDLWLPPSRYTIGVHAVLRHPLSRSTIDTTPHRGQRSSRMLRRRSTIDDYNWPVGLVAFRGRRSCSPSCGLASNNPVTIHSMEPCPISIQMLTRILIARQLETLNLKLLCVQIQSTFFYTKLLLSLKVQSLNLFLTSIINMDR